MVSGRERGRRLCAGYTSERCNCHPSPLGGESPGWTTTPHPQARLHGGPRPGWKAQRLRPPSSAPSGERNSDLFLAAEERGRARGRRRRGGPRRASSPPRAPSRQERQEGSVHDQPRVSLHPRRVGLVVVDAVAVERECREAEQQDLVGPERRDDLAPSGAAWASDRSRRGNGGIARVGRWRGRAVHQILLLLHGEPPQGRPRCGGPSRRPGYRTAPSSG
jgi:hypothetical protein